ncbi:hypothetical protein EDB89DRAFT_219115 [Lactarius sanguifluus]|nr:hypothetical protein EDB89DRAFT_219115 [Lactarius sanguifluus]
MYWRGKEIIKKKGFRFSRPVGKAGGQVAAGKERMSHVPPCPLTQRRCSKAPLVPRSALDRPHTSSRFRCRTCGGIGRHQRAKTHPDLLLPPNPPSRQLPPSKCAFLRRLSLADNALTFIPTEILPHLSSLTHLDLPSNLLVSVPPGLSSLCNLVSLNLLDNVIDSVLGIYKNLGQVLALNLSWNRLDSLCGLAVRGTRARTSDTIKWNNRER